jgi:prolyl-tRNA synthetase
VRSYRDLPLILYHLQIKERDEARPRAGVLRTREFITKDAYSFDRDSEGLDESYRLNVEAYDRIFDRCGLRWYRVEADVGMMGGSGAHEYMAPCPAGENEIALSSAGYAANVEVATGSPPAPSFPAPLEAPERVATPDARTIEEVSAYLGVDPATLLKALPLVLEDGTMKLALVRGDRRLNEIKLQNALGTPFRAATEAEILDQFGAEAGFIGPVGVGVEVIADLPVEVGTWVAGANETGFHVRGVEARRDFVPTARSRQATRVRRAPRSTSSRRSRWRTSSSSAPATPSRSVRPTWTRTDRSIRS